MTLHDSLPIVISIFGILVGVYMITKIKKLPKDNILLMDFVVLSLVNIYIGAIYLMFVLGIIPKVEDLSLFVRPANLLQIVVPALIAWRMGAI